MQRPFLRALCASFASLLFVSVLVFTASQVSAQTKQVLPSLAPTDISQAITVWVPFASNNSTLSGSVSVGPTLEPASAVSMSVPVKGGVLEATSANGNKFTLTIPDGALAVTTTVTLTPVASLSGMPFGEFVAGVQIAPANLGLWQSAALRIEPKSAIAVADQVSFGWLEHGADFHLYPLSLDPAKIEFSLHRLQGVGIGSTAAALAAGGDATANGAAWTPSDVLANIAQRTQPIVQQMREDTEANRLPNPELQEQFEALLRESWTKAIQPLLQPMTVSCDAAKASAPVVLGWLRQIQLLGSEEAFTNEAQAIGDAIQLSLENCIGEAAEPCFLMADTAQLEEILGYMRQLQLLGGETSIALEGLPKCQTIEVAMGGERSKNFAMQQDPETGWNTKALFTFSDDSAAGVLTVNPFGIFGTGATAKVTLMGRFGDVWTPLRAGSDRWLCRDKLADRIDALIVTISDVKYADSTKTTPPIPFYLMVSKVGCWRWSIEQSYSDEYTESEDLEWTHEKSINTTIEFTGTEPMAEWDASQQKIQIGYNPLRFALIGQGNFDYAMNYVYSGFFPCQSSLSANRTPPIAHKPFSDVFRFNIDESLPMVDVTGGLSIAINQPYQGNCPQWQQPLVYVSVGSSPGYSADIDLGASGRSTTGTANGYLGEQSGVWNASWSYQALRQ